MQEMRARPDASVSPCPAHTPSMLTVTLEPTFGAEGRALTASRTMEFPAEPLAGADVTVVGATGTAQ
jgi:hypothetical protein